MRSCEKKGANKQDDEFDDPTECNAKVCESEQNPSSGRSTHNRADGTPAEDLLVSTVGANRVGRIAS